MHLMARMQNVCSYPAHVNSPLLSQAVFLLRVYFALSEKPTAVLGPWDGNQALLCVDMPLVSGSPVSRKWKRLSSRRIPTWERSDIVRASAERDKVYSLRNRSRFPAWITHCTLTPTGEKPGQKGGIQEFGSVQYFLFLVGGGAEIPASKSILKLT